MTPIIQHKHVLVRAEINKPPGPHDCAAIEAWTQDLINEIGMKTLFGPKAIWCDMIGNQGTTVFAIIETSHVVLHFWTECSPAIVQTDVYTCGDLDPNIVFEALQTFDPIRVDFKFLDRETGLELVSEGVRT